MVPVYNNTIRIIESIGYTNNTTTNINDRREVKCGLSVQHDLAGKSKQWNRVIIIIRLKVSKNIVLPKLEIVIPTERRRATIQTTLNVFKVSGDDNKVVLFATAEIIDKSINDY